MERRSLPYGKKIRVKNFVILKYSKALKKSELKEVRNMQGIPADVQKHLQRGGLPYIKVSTLAENWSVEFVCGSTMYNYIDTRQMEPEFGDILTEDSVTALHNLFVMMLADCTVFGDEEYITAKGKLLQEYMARQKAKEETPEEKAADDKVLEDVKAEEEAKANIVDMAQHVKEQEEKGGDDGKG